MTSHKWLGALAGALALALIWGVLVSGSASRSQAAPLATAPLATATPDGDVNLALISIIESPNAICYRPVGGTGACYIQWGQLSVTAASSQYVISMTVAIDNVIRAYYSGFFQTSMSVPGDMTAPGFRVTCGAPGSAGIPDLGMSHAYTIRARETGGLGAANYGSVICPADVVRVSFPLLGKR